MTKKMPSEDFRGQNSPLFHRERAIPAAVGMAHILNILALKFEFVCSDFLHNTRSAL